MSGNDKLAPEDMDLFREFVGEVRPLKESGRTLPETDKPPPAPLQREQDERQVLSELLSFPLDPAEMETGEELAYLRPGLQRRYLTRLRRGHYSIAASLDLHEMNVETARLAILDFVEHAQQRGFSCIRIVHGKGLRSRKGPVLKWLTRRLLARHPAVAAFASCRPVDGGTGAVAVLLRGRRRG